MNSDNFHTKNHRFYLFLCRDGGARQRERGERLSLYLLSLLFAESNTGARKEVTTSEKGKQAKQSKTRQSEAGHEA